MDIRAQLCTRHQSEQILALGITAPSCFYHWQLKTPADKNKPLYGYRQEDMPWHVSYGRPSEMPELKDQVFAELQAYTTSELGVLMPLRDYTVRMQNGELAAAGTTYVSTRLETWCKPNVFRTVLIRQEGDKIALLMEGGIRINEAQSRAEMFIRMLNAGYLNPVDCNKWLSAE